MTTDEIHPSCVYDLPIHITVAREVLGTTVRTVIGGIGADILTAVDVYGAPSGAVRFDSMAMPPNLPGVDPNDELVRSPWDWTRTYASKDEPLVDATTGALLIDPDSGNPFDPALYSDGRTSLLRLGIVLTELPHQLAPGISPDLPEVDIVGLTALRGLATWFDSLRSWIEVLTGQDLDYRHPHYDVRYPGEGLHRWSGGRFLSHELPEIELSSTRPASRAAWKHALTEAGSGTLPPLEHRLARDATGARRRGDLRRAAIEAGTAVEVVLNLLYDATTPHSFGGKPQSHLSQAARNLTSLTNALDERSVAIGADDYDVRELIDIRNKAAHQAELPHQVDADRALETMTTLVKLHGTPLPPVL